MTFIIAEASVNHNGNFETALKLCDAAKASMADAVKFQLFKSTSLWSDERLKHLELSRSQMTDLHAYCEVIGIEFLCTPFGVEEALFLKPLVKRMKIASGCITRMDLLETVATIGLPVILSTGMSTVEEISRAFVALQQHCLITVLQCTSCYPCRLEDVNLMAMVNMKRHAFPVGYSDHTSGITVAIAAVALGATVIEKHLTLDRNAEGPDHKSSIMPREFKAMCLAIREVEAALGDGVKRVRPCEESLRALWRA